MRRHTSINPKRKLSKGDPGYAEWRKRKSETRKVLRREKRFDGTDVNKFRQICENLQPGIIKGTVTRMWNQNHGDVGYWYPTTVSEILSLLRELDLLELAKVRKWAEMHCGCQIISESIRLVSPDANIMTVDRNPLRNGMRPTHVMNTFNLKELHAQGILKQQACIMSCNWAELDYLLPLCVKYFPIVIAHIASDFARNCPDSRTRWFEEIDRSRSLATVMCTSLVVGRKVRRCVWIIKCATRELLLAIMRKRKDGGLWTDGR